MGKPAGNGIGCIPFESNSGTVDFNVLRFREPGDKFGQTMLSTHNFFRIAETAHQAERKRVLDYIAAFEVIIGVVWNPECGLDDERLDLVYSVAD